VTAPSPATILSATISSREIIGAIEWSGHRPGGNGNRSTCGGNQPVPLRDMVAQLGKALGREPKVQWAPMQPGDVQHTYADLSKSSTMLGYRPRVPSKRGSAASPPGWRSR
jgi:nucleoside-diphosphate-sugar epimerase